MMTVIPHFNMGRVVQDYAQGLYYPAAQQYAKLMRDGNSPARRPLADWKQRVRQAGRGSCCACSPTRPAEMPRGERLSLRVAAALERLAACGRARRVRRAPRLPESSFETPGAVLVRHAVRDGSGRALLSPTGEIDRWRGRVCARRATRRVRTVRH